MILLEGMEAIGTAGLGHVFTCWGGGWKKTARIGWNPSYPTKELHMEFDFDTKEERELTMRRLHCLAMARDKLKGILPELPVVGCDTYPSTRGRKMQVYIELLAGNSGVRMEFNYGKITGILYTIDLGVNYRELIYYRAGNFIRGLLKHNLIDPLIGYSILAKKLR